jgi:hypothetical protein
MERGVLVERPISPQLIVVGSYFVRTFLGVSRWRMLDLSSSPSARCSRGSTSLFCGHPVSSSIKMDFLQLISGVAGYGGGDTLLPMRASIGSRVEPRRGERLRLRILRPPGLQNLST